MQKPGVLSHPGVLQTIAVKNCLNYNKKMTASYGLKLIAVGGFS